MVFSSQTLLHHYSFQTRDVIYLLCRCRLSQLSLLKAYFGRTSTSKEKNGTSNYRATQPIMQCNNPKVCFIWSAINTHKPTTCTGAKLAIDSTHSFRFTKRVLFLLYCQLPELCQRRYEKSSRSASGSCTVKHSLSL